MAEEITRVELEWLEYSVKRNNKIYHYLTKEESLVLRLIDAYRRQKGWEGDGEEQR